MTRLFKATGSHVAYTVKVVVFRNGARWTLCYYTPLTGSMWLTWPIDSCHCHWPWVTLKSFAGCKDFQMQFHEHLCNIAHGFNWHRASRGPSATIQLLIMKCRNINVLMGEGWLGSRVISMLSMLMLDLGAEGPGFKSQQRRCRVTVLGKLFTPIVPLFTKQQNW